MDLHALRMLMLTGAPTQLCLAHYCDVHGPTPMMVTEGLPVPCSTCFDPDAPFEDRPATSASQPGAGPSTPPSVAAITDALRHITYSPHRSASLPASDLQSRPQRATLLRSPTSSAALPSGSAVETPPSSPDPHKSRTAVRRDSSFRRTYDEFVTKRAQPCDNCAMTLPKSEDEDATPASDTRGPTLRTRAPYAWVFGGSGGESPPNSQPSSASDTDNDGEGEGEGDGEGEGEGEGEGDGENDEDDDGLMKPPPPRRSGTGSTTSRSSVFSTVGGTGSGSGSHTHFIEYISTKEPVLPASFSIVRASCLRTLSFETLPRTTPSSAAAAAAAAAAASSPFASIPGTGSTASGGPIFFGDPAAGYTTAYIFRIPDLHARGHKRVYAFLALSTHSERTAMKTFGLIAGAFRDLAGWIQALAEAEAERAGGADSPGGAGSNSSSFLTGGGGGGGFGGGLGSGGSAFVRRAHGGAGGGMGMGNKVRQRGLAELVGCPDFFIQLHIRFVRILRELGVRMNA
ncbi:uncharacterized protein DNG_07124 [Cephalotrichum gorgonifer]|uniref:UDENN FLCN/SMCR8-type domain-containing protein n=1 Tax=Cephalotrichum gorgonifer TaxID=2041049 RepID=A0AAE8SX74_9PEZI|nr:uncharacterized protein DNG_07124 [Cephalotrichum gorgonifer]